MSAEEIDSRTHSLAILDNFSRRVAWHFTDYFFHGILHNSLDLRTLE